MLLLIVLDFVFKTWLLKNDSKRQVYQHVEESFSDPGAANAFITFHVKNPIVINRVQMVHKQLVNIDSRFSHALQPISSLHVTLALLNISDANIKNASLALDEVAGIYDMDHSELNIKFKGISSFGKESLYAAIEEESQPDLLDLYGYFQEKLTQCNTPIEKKLEVVKTVFNSYGIPTWTWFSQFQPHMTLAYLEPNEQKTLGPKWDKLKNAGFKFGIESVKSIQLCNITIDGSIHDYKILFDAELFSK